MWQSTVSNDSNGDDKGAFVHIFNENTSWHGHTVMGIEYSDKTFWGLSFQPKNEGEGKSLLLVGGVAAQLVNRTVWGQPNPGLSGPVSSVVLSYVITENQKNRLHEVIEREKNWISDGTVIYATIGIPIAGLLQSGYRDTCYSWVIRVLRDAGIISSLWVVTRPLSLAPSTGNFWGKTVSMGSNNV